MVAELAQSAADPWWIISSAAVALHRARVDQVRDVDVLMSGRDAVLVLAQVGVEPRRGHATRLFRSAVFGTWREPPLPVEIFGDFEVAGRDGWFPVAPQSREPVSVGGHVLFVPSACELREMLIAFGRPKDLARARLLAEG